MGGGAFDSAQRLRGFADEMVPEEYNSDYIRYILRHTRFRIEATESPGLDAGTVRTKVRLVRSPLKRVDRRYHITLTVAHMTL